MNIIEKKTKKGTHLNDKHTSHIKSSLTVAIPY